MARVGPLGDYREGRKKNKEKTQRGGQMENLNSCED